jgi:Skp family chaperone for outer membrane proteins
MTSLLFTAAATAQALPESRIAIIDYQLIQKNSTAMVEIQKQIEQRRLIYQQEISKQEQELRASDQELANQRSVLAADAFALKRREFEAKVAQVQRQVQDRKRELDRAFEYGMNQVQLVVKEIIADLAQQRNFNLVLSRQQIIFSENNLNISEDIVKLLNERLPLVQIP